MGLYGLFKNYLSDILWAIIPFVFCMMTGQEDPKTLAQNVYYTLAQNVYYPIQVHYDEQAFEAEIRLEWRLPGSSTFETIPGSAFFH